MTVQLLIHPPIQLTFLVYIRQVNIYPTKYPAENPTQYPRSTFVDTSTIARAPWWIEACSQDPCDCRNDTYCLVCYYGAEQAGMQSMCS